jgi:LPS-assembly protein
LYSRFTILAGLLLAAALAQADEVLECRNSLDVGFAGEAARGDPADPTFRFEAGSVEASVGESAGMAMRGGVTVRRGDRLAGAESADFDPADRSLHLEGNVRYEDSENQISSDSADFDYDSGRIEFNGARFSLAASNSRGGAGKLLITEAGALELDRVEYTTCPPGSNDWLLQADDIDLDTREGIGTARDIRLRFQGVPILWAPFISFPIGEARKSGILTPEIGSSGRSGNELRVPFYWNIAPNYDATITPRILTERGFQLQTEFRYLTEQHDGNLVAQYLPDDQLVDDSRHLVSARHRSLFDNGWRGLLDYRSVSDNQYFEDLGGSLSATSTTHLDRHLSFDWHSEHLDVFAQLQDFQTLDDAILPDEEPYRRLPQFRFSGWWPERIAGLSARLDAEIVNFDRDVGVTGWRSNFAPRIEAPLGGNGWFVKPALAWHVTNYELRNNAPGAEDSLSRSVPIGSVDAGLVLERRTTSSTRRIQTLEPRMLYVHVPYRDQDDLPVFDTISPDLNLVQLFRTNRFLGVDRIGDTDQVSLGITSRLLDVETGEELLTATIGQTRYLSDRQVTLPGGSPATFESSDYIAELRFLLYENLNFDVGYQWGSTTDQTTQSEARLQYRPAANKIVNLAYRYRRGALEQGDFSFSWPIRDHWNVVGRYNYSFRDEEALEQFFGLEYASCCWGIRLVSRRHISRRDGTRDSSFGLQLVLRGMTSVGTAADKLLERGILGYSSDLR